MIINLFNRIQFRPFMDSRSAFTCLDCKARNYTPKANFDEIICHHCHKRGKVLGGVRFVTAWADDIYDMVFGMTHKEAMKHKEAVEIGSKWKTITTDWEISRVTKPADKTAYTSEQKLDWEIKSVH